ncbi:Outer membrane protein P2 precursor [Photobacterium marinum]|uniref:Outer membrane protein P2 n=1 Tax=Photobacterium marinum TaxID=1056511 RepID=L8JIK4_9GAMM|nr:porin [Photobacterium marinum]ELR67309.1 Outer membrane protein P2 precursor [Photobacterium marinum]
MKKTVVAAVIGSVVASASAMAAEVYKSDELSVNAYGNLRARYETTDNGVMGADSTFTGEGTELGLGVTYFLQDGLYVNGDVLSEMNIIPEDGDGNDDDSFLKFGSIALGGDFGEFRIGRMSAIQDTLAGQYDISWEYAGTANIKDDAYATDRLTNGFQYKYDMAPYGLTMMVQYHTGDEGVDASGNANPNNGELGIDQAYALGVAWESEFGLGLSGTYTYSERTKQDVKYGGDDDTSWTLNATYRIQELSLAAMYSDYDFAGNEQTGIGAMARYDLPVGIGLYGIYDYVDYDTDDNTLDQYTIGADYWLNDSVVSYMEYADMSYDKQSSNGETFQDDSAFTIGMRVYF